jgi:UTP--glucose-1-phosphate uridylyltransferase
MLQYVIEEAVAAGIQSVIVITSQGKSALEDYFDQNVELERALEKANRTKQLEEVRRATGLARFCYVRQGQPLGLGHAVLTAEHAVGHEPFAVMLPDDLISSDVPALGQLMQVFHKYDASVVAVEEVPMERVSNYGVVDAIPLGENVYKVRSLVEKPPRDKAPSNLAIVGRYIFTPELFGVLAQTRPGAGGEIQLTDGISLLLKEQPVYACRFTGTRYDGGNPLGLLHAVLELGMMRDDYGPQIQKLIAELATRLK